MKQWLEDHPKAKLMARKRAAILDAAEAEFLSKGYDGTTMETVAAVAKVSIMTLYRHADDKADLFREVVGRACRHAAEESRADMERLAALPLDAALGAAAMLFQARLAGAETVALARTVMAVSDRFPDLAETVWKGLAGAQEEALAALLAQRDEMRPLGASGRRALAAGFLDRLAGLDMPRLLMGLPAASAAQRERRARDAVRTLLAATPPWTPAAGLV